MLNFIFATNAMEIQQLAELFWGSVENQASYTWKSILGQVPWYQNYFYGLILISLLVWAAEILFPWRKEQKVLRKDFFLDGFYMFFNFFLFSIAISGFYKLLGYFFSEMGIRSTSLALLPLKEWPPVVQLLVFFVLLDFVQWLTHVLLHRIEFLWRFHQVHHSVKEMGFAAHLRYHWMENVLYKPLKTLGVMLLGGFEPEQAYIVHFAAITIGHLNHANIKLDWGPLRYVLNNPVMHLYHHAYELPKGRFGVNFGISLSLWDYLFGTHHIPETSGKVALGFPGDHQMPTGFWGQLRHGFRRKKT